MALSRAAALRSCFRATRPLNVRPQLYRHAIRRGYASAGGHGPTKAGGDAIWAVGAVAVTLPTCWYLLANGPEAPHGHGEHHDSHGDSHDEEGESEEKEDGGKEDGEKEDEEKPDGDDENANDEKSEQSDDSDSGDEGEDADTPDTSDDEGHGDEKKGKEDGAPKKLSGERQHIPDAKGGSKKRVESDQSKKQGEEAKASADGSGPKDGAATSKTPGNQNTQSGKQEGVSSTDTKHSTPLTEKSDISKKGEGTPETAKAKGTVDSKRPAA